MASGQIRQVVQQLSKDLLRVEKGNVADQVIYIPNHLLGEHQNPEYWSYPNGIQPGFIYGLNRHGDYFCRYWRWDDRAKVYLPELRTLSNSELTLQHNLFFYKFFEERLVKSAIKDIQSEQGE